MLRSDLPDPIVIPGLRSIQNQVHNLKFPEPQECSPRAACCDAQAIKVFTREGTAHGQPRFQWPSHELVSATKPISSTHWRLRYPMGQCPMTPVEIHTHLHKIIKVGPPSSQSSATDSRFCAPDILVISTANLTSHICWFPPLSDTMN